MVKYWQHHETNLQTKLKSTTIEMNIIINVPQRYLLHNKTIKI